MTVLKQYKYNTSYDQFIIPAVFLLPRGTGFLLSGLEDTLNEQHLFKTIQTSGHVRTSGVQILGANVLGVNPATEKKKHIGILGIGCRPSSPC